MRTKWSIINSLVGFLVQAILLIVGLLSRRVFIQMLSVEYLGCEGVFSNMLHVLTLAGCAPLAVSYITIKTVASGEETEIKKAFALVKYYQKYSCSLLLLTGIAMGFFLPLFLSNTTPFGWHFLQIVYVIYLLDLLLSIWSGMGETPGRYDCMIKASQRQAICNFFNCGIRIGIIFLQMIILWTTQNYIAYLMLGICSRLIYILCTRWYCYRLYPYLRNPIKLDKDYIKEVHLFREIRSNFAIMLSIAVFGNTDNLVITTFEGIAAAGIYSNYYLIYSQLSNLAAKFIDSTHASVANFITTILDSSKKEELFYRIQPFAAAVASLCAIGFYGVSENIIETVLGEGLLLGASVTALLTVMVFLGIYSKVVALFRHSVGQYWEDQWFQIVASVVNLGLSILLVSRIGIQGVLIGTILGMCIQTSGYMYVTKKLITPGLSIKNWLFYASIWGCVTASGCYLFSTIFATMPLTIFGIILRICFAFLIWSIICILMIMISPTTRKAALYGWNIIKKVVVVLRQKITEGRRAI